MSHLLGHRSSKISYVVRRRRDLLAF